MPIASRRQEEETRAGEQVSGDKGQPEAIEEGRPIPTNAIHKETGRNFAVPILPPSGPGQTRPRSLPLLSRKPRASTSPTPEPTTTDNSHGV